MSTPYEAIERDIPRERVIGLRETLAGSPDGEDDFDLIKDLVSVIALSRLQSKRDLAGQVLAKMMDAPIQVYKITADSRMFVYVTFNGIEDGFFHVDTYPEDGTPIEECFTQRETDILERFCDT